MKHTILKTLALGAALLVQLAAASAGEITLYSRDNFRGEELTLRDSVRDLRAAGFNDRASSLVVRWGAFELCEHKDFGGACVVVERGEYPNMGRLNNNISSIRELDRRGAQGRGHRDEVRTDGDGRDYRNGGEYRDHRDDGYGRDGRDERYGRDDRVPQQPQVQPGFNRPDPIELFDGERFEGRRVPLQGEMRSMRAVDFNDRAGSLVIYEGQWQLCEHDNFGGQCLVYGPGRYESLGAMNNKVSSLRRIR
ncbi:MAG: beta/gamma crystallin-related protein [Pseudomonadota bacterium]